MLWDNSTTIYYYFRIGFDENLSDMGGCYALISENTISKYTFHKEPAAVLF
jgi:hypothetical protein